MSFDGPFPGFEDVHSEQPGSSRHPGAKPEPDAAADRFEPINFPGLIGLEPPARRFVVRDWMPVGCVTGLWGAGGIGKSLLAQQIATCVAMGVSGFGFSVEHYAPVVGIFSEDDNDELWRRQCRINPAIGADMHHLQSLHLQGRAGLENTLATYPTNKPAVVCSLFGSIVTACEAYRPGLLILDNVAQLFGGNENDRYQVSHFCNLIAGFARDFGCAVLLLGHPAKMEGSEYSGSTAWNAAVRSRLFLARDGEGEVQLTRPKANYAQNGTMPLVWIEGVLHPVKGDDLGFVGEAAKQDREHNAEKIFLAALDRLTGLGEVVSSSARAGSYAPRLMVKMGMADGLREAVLRDAMLRLIECGELVTDHPVKQRADRKWAYGLARKPVAEEAPAEEQPAAAEEEPSNKG